MKYDQVSGFCAETSEIVALILNQTAKYKYSDIGRPETKRKKILESFGSFDNLGPKEKKIKNNFIQKKP